MVLVYIAITLNLAVLQLKNFGYVQDIFEWLSLPTHPGRPAVFVAIPEQSSKHKVSRAQRLLSTNATHLLLRVIGCANN